jgi:dienelactone hydrolase
MTRQNANGLEVIRPLRLGLADAGWDTLSLQLPSASRTLGRAAWLSRQQQIVSRLQAGLNWLGSRKPANQVIIAQGDSGSMVLEYALDSRPPELKALVLVSAFLDSSTADAAVPAGDRAPLPVLDIYAQRDYPGVVGNAQARLDSAYRDARSNYQQRVVDGATGGFFGLEADLLARISAWLATNVTSGQE